MLKCTQCTNQPFVVTRVRYEHVDCSTDTYRGPFLMCVMLALKSIVTSCISLLLLETIFRRGCPSRKNVLLGMCMIVGADGAINEARTTCATTTNTLFELVLF